MSLLPVTEVLNGTVDDMMSCCFSDGTVRKLSAISTETALKITSLGTMGEIAD